jgi:virulence factor
MKSLIEKYKNKKKQAIIRSRYCKKYAFAGIGAHALGNLYPVLDYLNADIRYIITRSDENAALVSEHKKPVIGISNPQQALSDPDVKGVFVCISPSAHFTFSKKILEAGKHLFVEKPPCSSLSELQELIGLQKKNNLISVVGLQKRYAPVYHKLKAISEKALYYSLKYQTGAYPEGDVLLDLFIHPLDLSIYLFGKAQAVSIQKMNRNNSCFTYLIHLKHENGTTGSLELSTDYSWTGASEQIIVNTAKSIYHSTDISSLSRTRKPAVIAGIPFEKVKSFNPVTEQLYSQNNFLPVREHNQLYSAGFYGEIETFLNLCEGKKAQNNSSLEQIADTYQLIEDIRR